MLCKKTYKNQITLPKKIIQRFQNVEYFEVEAGKDRIILKPVKITPITDISLVKIKEKISSLRITEKDIKNAVLWARRKK